LFDKDVRAAVKEATKSFPAAFINKNFNLKTIEATLEDNE